jgi:hypothetical protein
MIGAAADGPMTAAAIPTNLGAEQEGDLAPTRLSWTEHKL